MQELLAHRAYTTWRPGIARPCGASYVVSEPLRENNLAVTIMRNISYKTRSTVWSHHIWVTIANKSANASASLGSQLNRIRCLIGKIVKNATWQWTLIRPFIFISDCPVMRVAAGGVKFLTIFAQSQIALLLPDQERTRQGQKCNQTTWSFVNLWAVFPWV